MQINLCKGQLVNNGKENADSSLKVSVTRAINYFNDKEKVHPYSYLILDYLIRKYEISFTVDKDAIKKSFKEKNSPSLNLFYSLIDPKNNIDLSKIETVEDTIENYLLKALFCKIKLPDEHYVNLLENEIEKRGYSLTHAAIAIEWLKENGCDKINQKKIDSLQNGAAKMLVELAKKENFNSDLGIEAMAVLCYVKKQELINSNMINKVLEAQKEDGGWGYNFENKTSNEHTSTLALWLLLGFHQGDKNPSVKWTVK